MLVRVWAMEMRCSQPTHIGRREIVSAHHKGSYEPERDISRTTASRQNRSVLAVFKKPYKVEKKKS